MMYEPSSLAASLDIIDWLCKGETEKTRKKVIDQIILHEQRWFTQLAEIYFPDWIIDIARTNKDKQSDIYKKAERWVETNGFAILRNGPRSFLMWKTGGAMLCIGSLWVEKNNNVIEIYST